MHGSLTTNMATTELNVNRLTATLFSNFGARLQQPTASYKYNKEHEWIEQDMYNKTYLVNISRIMHEMTCRSRFTWQQNITNSVLAEMTKSQKSATPRRLIYMLVLVTT